MNASIAGGGLTVWLELITEAKRISSWGNMTNGPSASTQASRRQVRSCVSKVPLNLRRARKQLLHHSQDVCDCRPRSRRPSPKLMTLCTPSNAQDSAQKLQQSSAVIQKVSKSAEFSLTPCTPCKGQFSAATSAVDLNSGAF